MKRKSNRSKDSVLPGSGRLRCHCGMPCGSAQRWRVYAGYTRRERWPMSVPDIRIVIPL